MKEEKGKGKMTKENRNAPTPAYEARLNHIRLTIWENVNKGSSYFNTVITRRYKEGDEFKESNCRFRFGIEPLFRFGRGGWKPSIPVCTAE